MTTLTKVPTYEDTKTVQIAQARAVVEHREGAWYAATYYDTRHAADFIRLQTAWDLTTCHQHAAQWLEAYAAQWDALIAADNEGK